MTALDLHPEELLDKAAAGALTDAEREHLGRHLAQCSVCRFEQTARADFAAAASAVDAAQVDSLVARALAGMPTQGAAFGGPRRRTPWVLAAAVAMFAVASFAAVGQLTGYLPKLIETWVAPEPVPMPAPAPVVPARRAAPKSVEAVEAIEEAVAPITDPEVPTVAPAAPRAAPKRVVPVAAAPLGAAELFAAANAARIRGDRAEAALRYNELVNRFPASDEARLTHATLGRMLLDTGDVKGALQHLDTYLALDDETLREEAMSARARALALAGRTSDEAAAWARLLQEYPTSVHAERARSRLEELGRSH